MNLRISSLGQLHFEACTKSAVKSDPGFQHAVKEGCKDEGCKDESLGCTCLVLKAQFFAMTRETDQCRFRDVETLATQGRCAS